MYFDIKPKRRKEDFYNYEKEIDELVRLVRSSRLIVIIR